MKLFLLTFILSSLVQLLLVGCGAGGGPVETSLPSVVEVPDIEIIVDATGLDGSGTWSAATGASDHYGAMSYYAVVGGSIDTYVVTTAPITVAGNYRVYVWNSCYSPRADNVPHVVGSIIGGVDTVIGTQYLDQHCGTAISGEWEEIGLYSFSLGAQAYVSISDTGLSSGSYFGVDAVRLVLESF